ncbi:MAG: response regulator transcription factor [Acidobacteria bacterium]|nr:response regulator transcription factor [Acidobacteriota bacterium]MBS1865548.1 response regulator transcription factor [Acidobacteriota bacterium]
MPELLRFCILPFGARGRYKQTVQQTKTERSGDWPATRVLVVDDDVELCELVEQYLRSQGFDVDSVYDGTTGVANALSNSYDMIILDVMLPGIRGFEALRQIRAKSSIPVIMLTAHGEDVDRIVGLEIGADDYMPKPFNPRELAARIHAILRRTNARTAKQTQSPAILCLEDVRIDLLERTAHRKTRDLELTSAEFELLALFFKSPGQVLTREELVKNVLGRDMEPSDRSLDVHISNLRKKIALPEDDTERIRAIRNVGYVYVVSNSSL